MRRNTEKSKAEDLIRRFSQQTSAPGGSVPVRHTVDVPMAQPAQAQVPIAEAPVVKVEN